MDLHLICPSGANPRLQQLLTRVLEGKSVKVYRNAEDLQDLRDKKLLFALGLDRANFLAALAALALLFLADLLQARYGSLRPWIARQVLPVRWAVYLAGALTVLIFGIYGPTYDVRAFTYFQF